MERRAVWGKHPPGFAVTLRALMVWIRLRGQAVSSNVRSGGDRDSVAIKPLLIERMFDALWLALGIGFTALFLPLPREPARAGDMLGAGLLAGTGVFQLVCVAGLTFFGVPRPVASSFALAKTLVFNDR